MAAINIKNLSVPELLGLRADIDKTLQSRKTELQMQLAQIGGESHTRGSRLKGGKVAAKYRHPETGETWSGRGGVAGWLAAELKAGKKREDFLIQKDDAAPKTPKSGKGSRGRRKAA
jgi:hypothetical protein